MERMTIGKAILISEINSDYLHKFGSPKNTEKQVISEDAHSY